MSPARRSIAALALYAVVAVVYWGLGVAGHPSSTIVGANALDPSTYIWFFGWWPHAIADGLNPFISNVIFVPGGYNLAWVTSMPGPSLLMAPVTSTLGPVVTYNVISLAAPALSAWTAYLLCAHVSRSFFPSLLGGYLFGFSSYMVGHLVGAPQLALVALLPVGALLVLLRVQGAISARRFVVLMTLTAVVQLSISTEVFATAAFFGTWALGLAAWLFPANRGRLKGVVGGLLASLAGAAALASPLLYYVLFHPFSAPVQAKGAGDLLALAVPGYLQQVSTGHTVDGAPGWASGYGYIGLPLLALIAIYVWTNRNRPEARLLAATAFVAVVASLGAVLRVRGHSTGVPLPWELFDSLPFLRYAIPVRFVIFAMLPIAVMATLWLSTNRSAWRWALAALAVLMIVPNVGNAAWRTKLTEPRFLSEGGYRGYLGPQDRVLTVPNWGSNMYWQAREGFPFQIAGGYVGAFPAAYLRYPAWQTLLSRKLEPGYRSDVRRLVRDKGVTVVLVDKAYPGPWRKLFAGLGVRPRDTGGVLLYDLRRGR